MEQHFVGMLCFAWSSNLSVDIRPDSDPRNWLNGEYGAQISIPRRAGGGAGDNDTMSLTFVRKNIPVLANTTQSGKLEDHDVLLLGGFHHGGIQLLPQYLESFKRTRVSAAGQKRLTVMVEALPAHRPGGRQVANNKFPVAISGRIPNMTEIAPELQPACDSYSGNGDPKSLNPQIHSWFVSNMDDPSNSSLSILPVEHLYRRLGEAHIGRTGPNDRDCLHWCFGPGVLDALIRQTLAVVAKGLTR